MTRVTNALRRERSGAATPSQPVVTLSQDPATRTQGEVMRLQRLATLAQDLRVVSVGVGIYPEPRKIGWPWARRT